MEFGELDTVVHLCPGEVDKCKLFGDNTTVHELLKYPRALCCVFTVISSSEGKATMLNL